MGKLPLGPWPSFDKRSIIINMSEAHAYAAKTIEDLLISTKPRAVVAGPKLLSSLPGIDRSFVALDKTYADDRHAYFGELAGTVEEVPGYPGLIVSIKADDRVQDVTKLAINKAPLDSTFPQSTPFKIAHYAANESAGYREKQKARPNTWNEIGKLATNYEIAVQQGVGMPMATIYNPVPKELFTKEELDQIARGDTSPWGRIFKAVADYAQEKLHGKDGPTQFEELYVMEPGMGHEAVGAVDWLQQNDPNRRVRALITPNLVAGVRNRFVLLGRYSVKATMGEIGEFEPTREYIFIPEPLMRLETDKNGAEFAMRKRQLTAMFALLNPGAMTRSEWLRGAMQRVVENGTAFVAPISVNANIARNTVHLLPNGHPNFWLLPVLPLKEQYADLGTNENYSLGAVEFVEAVLFADDLEKTRTNGNGSRV
jgi:hypothetical protein